MKEAIQIKSNEVKICELRVGNLVYLKHGSYGYRIHRVSPTLLYRNEKVTERLKFSKPIPLTPEILEKCGFVPHHNLLTLQFGRKYFSIGLDDQTIVYQPDIGLMGIELNCDCDYLHQLQNLYFALTGNELEINL